ncbi:unnamed protein product [Ectocarpus sp. 12 AP-2014]
MMVCGDQMYRSGFCNAVNSPSCCIIVSGRRGDRLSFPRQKPALFRTTPRFCSCARFSRVSPTLDTYWGYKYSLSRQLRQSKPFHSPLCTLRAGTRRSVYKNRHRHVGLSPGGACCIHHSLAIKTTCPRSSRNNR